MAIWGKMFGGVAGFAVGGPFGALMGAALGHAADNGSLLKPSTGGWSERFPANGRPDPNSAAFFGAAKIAAALGKRDQLYAIGLVALCAKLAKIDGPVNRHEINAFKTCFQFPPDNTKEVGMLFDRARDRTDDFEMYAREMGKAYADNTAPLENLMTALFRIARADAGPSRELHPKEIDFLQRVHGAFGLPPGAWRTSLPLRLCQIRWLRRKSAIAGLPSAELPVKEMPVRSSAQFGEECLRSAPEIQTARPK